MSINIERRNAFTRAFANYPAILLTVAADKDGTYFKNEVTGQLVTVLDEDQIKAVAQVFMAQFFTRLMQTRCQNAPAPLVLFGEETVKRYNAFTARMIGAYSIYSEQRTLAPLHVFEQNMSNVIFQALAEEAAVMEIAEAAGEDIKPMDEFSEADFWTDVFLSFAGHNRPNGPRWNLPAQEIFGNAKDDFIAACREFPQ